MLNAYNTKVTIQVNKHDKNTNCIGFLPYQSHFGLYAIILELKASVRFTSVSIATSTPWGVRLTILLGFLASRLWNNWCNNFITEIGHKIKSSGCQHYAVGYLRVNYVLLQQPALLGWSLGSIWLGRQVTDTTVHFSTNFITFYTVFW